MTYNLSRKVILLLMLVISLSSGAEFGGTCVAPDNDNFSVSRINDLKYNSVFWYVKSLIDVSRCGPAYTNGCAITTLSEQIVNLCADTSDAQKAKALDSLGICNSSPTATQQQLRRTLQDIITVGNSWDYELSSGLGSCKQLEYYGQDSLKDIGVCPSYAGDEVQVKQDIMDACDPANNSPLNSTFASIGLCGPVADSTAESNRQIFASALARAFDGGDYDDYSYDDARKLDRFVEFINTKVCDQDRDDFDIINAAGICYNGSNPSLNNAKNNAISAMKSLITNNQIRQQNTLSTISFIVNNSLSASGSQGDVQPRTINVCVRNYLSPTESEASPANSAINVLNVGDRVKLSSLTKNQTVLSDPNLANIVLSVEQKGEQICVLMPTQYGGVPLACKKYIAPTNNSAPFRNAAQCKEVSDGCDLFRSDNNSKTPNNWMGSCVKCIYETLEMMFFDPRTCDDNSKTAFNTISKASFKPFAEFYSQFRFIVMSALTLYVLFFGINLALSPGDITLNDAIIAVIKILAVSYFTLGTSMFNYGVNNKAPSSNGITELVLPMMISFSESMSSYFVENGSNNNLCSFSRDDYEEDKYFAIWDSIDCRLNVYLGNTKLIWNRKPSGATVVPTLNTPSGIPAEADDHGKVSDGDAALKTIALIFMLIFTGFLVFVLFGATIIIIISICLGILTGYLVAIAIMFLMAYLAPIFVPMALFEKTKSYYQNWLGLCIGCSIQPVLILAFTVFLFNVIDSYMFAGCYFKKYAFTDPDTSSIKYFFEMILPDSTAHICKKSTGYKIYKLLQDSGGHSSTTLLLFEASSVTDIYDLSGSIWPGLFLCIFVYHMIRYMYSLIAELSGGISVQDMEIKPSTIAEKTAKLGSKINNTINSLEARYKNGGK